MDKAATHGSRGLISGDRMRPELEDIFAKYEQIRAEADGLFHHVSGRYPDCAICHKGCSDCCHAVFDLSLVEALYLNDAFKRKFPHGPERSKIMEHASDIDRKLTKIKRELYHSEKRGDTPDAIMDKASSMRMPCPLLDEKNQCVLYDARPITCRLYGIPLVIGEKSHVCGFSGFDAGKQYPAVQLGKIQERLEALSREIAERLGSRFELDEVYVPVSMALLTRYDDAYLGIGEAKEES